MMGQPVGGFSREIQDIVLKGKTPITCRPGELLPPVDFEKIRNDLTKRMNRTPSNREVLSYALYPKVFDDFISFIKKYGDLSMMDSPLFFDGLRRGTPFDVELAEGKIFIIELIQIGKIDSDGNRRVVFEVNGNRREMTILDKTYRSEKASVSSTQMADPDNQKEIGAGIPGSVSKIMVKDGDAVKEGDSLLILEAMKMETNITAPISGVISVVAVKEGQRVKNGELLIKFE
jgi:pyruvate carboxylase